MITYCDNCQAMCEVKEKNITKEFNVKGVLVTATIHILICAECNKEVWDENIEKENEIIVFSEYRKKMHLLFPEDIKAIRKKYGLSQASFSKLLGFGEKTITRYENGSIQDICHDNLIRLMEDKKAFFTIWEERKSVLTNTENKKIEAAFNGQNLAIQTILYNCYSPYKTTATKKATAFSIKKGDYKNVG